MTALLVLYVAISCQPAVAAESLTFGERHTFESKTFSEPRRYFVHKPDGYDWSDDRYPVLVVLDPEFLFSETCSAVDFLSRNERIPSMLVVGVANSDRTLEMTPPLSPPNSTSGGAEKLQSFIADELLPEIDRTYRTQRYRVLQGTLLVGSSRCTRCKNVPRSSMPTLQSARASIGTTRHGSTTWIHFSQLTRICAPTST